VQTIRPAALDRLRLDNASLLARRTYSTELALFDAVWEAEGRDLRRAIARVTDLAEDADDPFAALRAWRSAVSSPTDRQLPAAEPPPQQRAQVDSGP
jgi:hypothetical protein